MDDQFIEPLLLERLLRAELEVKNAVLHRRIGEMETQITLLRAQLQQTAHTAQLAAATQNYQNVVKELEGRYHVDMRSYGYDAETGKLAKLDAEAN